MAQKNIKGRLLIIIGTVLLLAALSLVFYNNYRQRKSNEDMQSVLDDVKSQIVINTQPSNEDSSNIDADDNGTNDFESVIGNVGNQDKEDYIEPSIEVEEKEYIGILEVPAIGLELPVMSDWSYEDLYITACRYSGNVAEGNIIIAAHNYRYFFGPIDNLNSGDIIIFTGADGSVYTYEVSQTDLVDGSDAASLKAGSDDWDLTLFTCTWSGTSRLAVRARLIENE